MSEIAYPAITICSQNRFHKERCEEAEAKFLPQGDNETIKIFRVLISSLIQFEFGALDEFNEEVFKFTSPVLDALNLTAVMEFVMLRCEEIYIGRCWWRNKYFNCCNDFLFTTRSEYGLCFSFNSAVNDIGKEKDVRLNQNLFSDQLNRKCFQANESIHYPYRTSNYGDWSGLRVELSARSDIALQEDVDGVTIIVQHPDQWPNSGQFVPSGSQTAIVIKPTFSYTTEDVRRLSPEERQCLNVSETLAKDESNLIWFCSLGR